MPTDVLRDADQLGPENFEEIDGLSSAEIEDLRDHAQNDLYFCCVGVLGFRDVNPRVHGPFCRHIQTCPKSRRAALMPRGHLKSSIASIGDPIRLSIKDPDNERVLIVGETATLAENFLGGIKNQFTTNKLLRGLFPELIPERMQGPGITWRNDAASLNRSSAWPEPTFRAIGVGGASVGFHYTRIKADDLVGFEAIRSQAEMQYVKAWVDTMEPLLVKGDDIIDFTGTRWGRNDLFAHIFKNYGDEIGVYTRGAVENGEIIFPEKFNWDFYARIQRTNPAQWAAQYENNPLTSLNTDFKIEAVRHYRFDYEGERVWLSPKKSWHLDELDRVLTADPNSGQLLAPDAAAITVVGRSPDDEVIVLESWSGRVSPSDYVDQIYNFARRWKVRVVGIEKAGQQNTDHYFKLKAEKESYYVAMEELRPRGRAKPDRVRGALQPLINSGLLYVLPSQTILWSQLSEFPDCILWDEVDALSYAPEVWIRPERKEIQQRREGIVKKLLAMRNKRTGY